MVSVFVQVKQSFMAIAKFVVAGYNLTIIIGVSLSLIANIISNVVGHTSVVKKEVNTIMNYAIAQLGKCVALILSGETVSLSIKIIIALI